MDYLLKRAEVDVGETSKEDVIEFLSSLNEVDFVDVFYKAVEQRKERDVWGGEWLRCSHLMARSVVSSGDLMRHTLRFSPILKTG